MAVDDECLLRREAEAVARALGLERDLYAGGAWRLRRSRARRAVAARDARQVLRLLRALLPRASADDRRTAVDKERRGQQVAADLLQHDARLDMAEPEAAVILADQDAGEAHLGERLPQIAAEAGRVLGVAQLAQVRDRRLVGDEIARGVAQHRLFFVEDEGHEIPIPSTRHASPAKAGTRDGSGSRQIQNPLGDDVELDLAGAALDRIGLGAQPARARRAPASSPRSPIRARPMPPAAIISSWRLLFSSVP